MPDLRKAFEQFIDPRAAWAKALRLVAITVILAVGTVVVYGTGGTKFVWPHLMYFGVVLAGITFGRRVGITAGIVAGLLMGPLMPLDVEAGISQPTRGWLVRMGFYVGIGALAGYSRFRFERLLDRRRSFLSSVSHELRTPLSAVLGFAQILERDWDEIPERQKRELVGHIHRESVDMTNIVEDLLVAARIDSGRLHIQCERVDVRRVAESVLEALPPHFQTSRIRVDGIGESWVDPVRLRQILRNLLINALIHGGDRVNVDVRNGHEAVQVLIRDDGDGIPDMILPRLFESFTAHTNQTRPLQSVGMGLAVSRELARRMGGRLTYERRQGQSVFTLELPASRAPHPVSAAESPAG